MFSYIICYNSFIEWKITYYNESLEEAILALPNTLLARYIRLTEAMQKHGPNLGMPHTKAMGTSTSVVGRLETGGGKEKHSPTLATLEKYAKAVGCVLCLKLVPHKIQRRRSINK
jgi:hypothetical protein